MDTHELTLLPMYEYDQLQPETAETVASKIQTYYTQIKHVIADLSCINQVLGIDIRSSQNVQEKQTDYLISLIELYSKSLKTEDMPSSFDREFKVLFKFFENLTTTCSSARHMLDLRAFTQGASSALDDEDFIYRGMNAADEEMSSYQKGLLHCYEKLKKNNWKRHKDSCFEQRYVCKVTDLDDNTYFVPENLVDESWHNVISRHRTYYWTKICDIAEVIDKHIINRYNDPESWKYFTKPAGNYNSIRHHLLDIKYDPDFPMLTQVDHARSFRNGILLFLRMGTKFLPYDCDVSKFEQYDLTANAMTREWYDTEFDSFACFSHDPMDIPVPLFQSIMDYQKFDVNSARTIYGLLGRLLHRLGTFKENWQIIPFVKGVAGTGKSTIGKIVGKMFNHDDVGNVSSDIETTFGLEPLQKTSIWMCFEVTKQFRLSTADFLTMVSGKEPLTIRKKGLVAETIVWDKPGICFGNQMPNWRDTQGNLVRRIVFVPFNQILLPDEVNGRLEDEIVAEEMGLLMAKCHNSYVYMLNTIGEKDVWSFMPKMFKREKMKMSLIMNPLRAFLESRVFERGTTDQHRMTLETLRDRIELEFRDKRNVAIDDDSIEGTCRTMRLGWNKENLIDPDRDNNFNNTIWVRGLKFNTDAHRRNVEEVEEDEDVVFSYVSNREETLV